MLFYRSLNFFIKEQLYLKDNLNEIQRLSESFQNNILILQRYWDKL